jgi:hypothetical protein
MRYVLKEMNAELIVHESLKQQKPQGVTQGLLEKCLPAG